MRDDQPLVAYMSFAQYVGAPLLLTSAYDWSALEGESSELAHAAHSAWTGEGGRMVLDSGWYEASWRSDASWAHESYVACALELLPEWVLSFDEPDGGATTGPLAAESAIRRWRRDQAAIAITPVVPLLHALADQLPDAARRVASETGASMIAIPERELGDGIVARAAAVAAIRRQLDAERPGIGLHLLGTGSPLSILAYCIAGAQSFDGLEWCRTSVDHTTARLYHSHHFDFFSSQTGLEDGSYWGRRLAHSLLFWNSMMRDVQDGKAMQLLQMWAPAGGAALLSGGLGGLTDAAAGS